MAKTDDADLLVHSVALYMSIKKWWHMHISTHFKIVNFNYEIIKLSLKWLVGYHLMKNKYSYASICRNNIMEGWTWK